MLIDIHTHTARYSGCGRSKPEDMVAAARDAGLDGLVITEHDMLWPESELLALRAQFPAMTILRGIEVTVESGDHFLVYGLTDLSTIRWHMSARELLCEVRRQQAAVVLAHPYRYEDVVPDAVVPGAVSAIEIMSKNIHGYNHERAVSLARDLGAHVTAASDGHHVDQLGLYALDFVAGIASERQLADALRQGRYSLHVNHARVAARNAWLDTLLPEVDGMIAQGRSDRAIHKRFPELTFTILEHYRQGMDVHWADHVPAAALQQTF